MKKLLFQGRIGCLGTVLLITYFSPVALATQGQFTPGVMLAQSQGGTGERPRECNSENNEAAHYAVQELVGKAREYASSGKKEEALEKLNQAFELIPTLKNAEVKANIIRDIIVTLDGDTSLLDKLVALYVEAGQNEQVSSLLSQAQPLTQSLSSSYSFIKTGGLAAIARHYVTIGQKQKGLQLLSGSLQGVNSLQGADFKTLVLTDIAKVYVAAGQLEPVAEILSESLKFAKAIANSNPYRKPQALTEIAITYAKIGQYKQAIELAQTIANAPYYKATALDAFATQYAQTGQIEQALQIAQMMELPQTKAITLTAIAARYAKAGQQDKASQVFSQAVQVAQSVNPGASVAVASSAMQYAEAGQPDAALSVVQGVNDDPHSKAMALAAIALQYGKAGQAAKVSPVLSQALETIPAIPETYKQQQLRQDMIRNFVQAGQYDYALQVVPTIDDEFAKSETLQQIAIQAAEGGQQDKALRIVQMIDKKFVDYRNGVYQKIALSYSRVGQFDKAIQVAKSIQNYGSSYTSQARTLAAISTQLSKAGQANLANEVFAQALQVANSLQGSLRVESLGMVALEYALGGQENKANEILSQALQLAQSIEDSSSQSSSLRAIAESYIYAERYDLAFRVAQAMKDTSDRGYKLQEITDKYIEGGQYDTALQVANLMQTPSDKARLLVAIAGKYIQTGQKNKATEILAQAFQVTRTIEGPESKIIVVKAETDAQGKIISSTQVDDPYDRASLLEEVALKYGQAGQYNQAIQVTQVIESASIRNLLTQRLACYQ